MVSASKMTSVSMWLRRICSTRAQFLSNRSVHSASVLYSYSSDKDFLHRSIVSTDHFQKSLPHLPIPKLEDTCQRYLSAQKPLLTDEEYSKTEKIVQDFQANEGQALHNQLVAKDKQNKSTSYISEPWFDMYLKDRRAIMLNHNPFLVLNNDQRPEYNDQLLRSTNLVLSSLRFMKTFRANVLEPEIFHLDPSKSDTQSFRKFVRLLPKSLSWYGAYWYKAYPLDMSQYWRLFNSTRIPRPVKDELYTDQSATHISVLRKGHVYTVDCINSDGTLKSGSELMACLQYILTDSRTDAAYCPAVLTSLDRDSWTDVREKLVLAGNEAQLNAIDSSIFTLDLDDDANTQEHIVDLCKSFLYGNASNRWFDKCLQLIVNKSGVASVHFEHSWGDGVAVLRYIIETFKETTENTKVAVGTKPASVDCETLVKKIEFNLTDDLKADIDSAKKSFHEKASTLSLDYLEYDKFGKNDIKKMKVSPDSFMQLAIQMAYHKLTAKTAATYESCSTAAFKHGRTETVRPCTVQTKTACELFAQRKGTLPSLQDLSHAMRECSTRHMQLTKEAAMGQGFDRHLFAMRYMAQAAASAAGTPVPSMFTDSAYTNINQIILSTSTLGHPAVKIGGFGPVVPHGFGVGYGVLDEGLGGIVTGYPGQDPTQFLSALSDSFDDMHCVLEGKDFRT